MFVDDLQMFMKELRDNRKELNAMVVSKVKETEFSCDFMQGMQEEVQKGICAAVELLDEETMRSVSLTRSIPVRELRSKGWRTRTVHHFSEGGINNATRPAGRIVHQALHHRIFLVMMFMRMGMEPLMFKHDVRKAYRTIPICVKCFEFAHVCFVF